MRLKMFFLWLMLSLITSATFYAQEKKNSEEEVLRIDTQLVDVPIVVMDKNGKPLLNLKQNNFIIYEDGKIQEISDFSTTSAPFEVVLLLDTSGSARADLDLIQRAAAHFIASLRPGDRVSIIAFKSDKKDEKSVAVSEVLTPLTDDRNKLKNVLAQVKTSNGTPYYDGLLQAVERVFSGQPKDEFRGRRALVALTDGVDSTSAANFDEVRENIAQAGIVSYFIQVDTREFFEENLLGDCESALRFSAAQIKRYYRVFYPRSKIEKVSGFCQLGDFERLDISRRLYELADTEMQDLAKMSGGKVFAIADLSEAQSAFKKVADEIGTKYSLGYYPANEKRDGGYRKIKIELKGIPAGAQIRAREGYTAPTN
ncbi:MAG: VWA domain-containing protein [Acidobacteriota bacterium]|nr:VWA domain-containing protein [Acidobacteriota bacterium]